MLESVNLNLYSRHFLPFGRTDLSVSSSLERIRGDVSQLHRLHLEYTAISIREYKDWYNKIKEACYGNI
jgi:hypothetical protein